MPNPSAPIEVKKRRGTYRKDRAGGAAVLAVVPAAGFDGWELGIRDALERVLGLGVPWLGMTDNPTLALLADALDVHEKAKIVGTIRDQIEAMKAVASFLSQLGFDPTSRSKLGLAEVKAQSTLEAMRARSSAKVSDRDQSSRKAEG